MGLNEKRNEGQDGRRSGSERNERTDADGGVNNNPSLLLSADGEKGAVMRDGTKTAADLQVVGVRDLISGVGDHHHHHRLYDVQ